MRKIPFVLLAVLVFCPALSGQHGSAGSGYYPLGYGRDTWTGEVTAVNDATREITLTYKGKKTESFTGVLIEGYKVKVKDGSTHELRVSAIPIGERLKVYYIQRTRKADGRKVRYDEIFGMERAAKETK